MKYKEIQQVQKSIEFDIDKIEQTMAELVE